MNLLAKIKNDDILNKISTEFDNEIYLVGGAVRDFLLDKATFDRDLIVCDMDAKVFAQKVASELDATFVPLDEVNKIYRIVLKDKLNYLDITNPVENSLEADLKRRDLTINAIAVNIKTGETVDVTSGVEDFNNKIIRIISEQNILDDPLRILRVFRFHANLGFEIDNNTLEIISKHIDLIHKPAVERVNYEIMKMFSGHYVDSTLLLADKYGLLEKIFPIINELKQVPPNSHHHLDLFHHSVETVRQIELLYQSCEQEVKEHLDSVDFGGFSRLAHLKLAGFLHDIGKFSTWTIEKDTGRHRFIKHDDVGAKLALPLLKKLHFSNKQIDYIVCMIKNHIYPSNVVSGHEVTDKIMMRFVRKMDDNSLDNIILAKADRLSALGQDITEQMINDNINALSKLQEFYLSVKDTLEPLPILLDGHEVMKLLDIKPSPILGKVMENLHEAQISGDILTKEDAIRYILQIKSNL